MITKMHHMVRNDNSICRYDDITDVGFSIRCFEIRNLFDNLISLYY